MALDFFGYISDVFSNLVRVFMSITVFDVIDMILLAVLICVVINSCRKPARSSC